MMSFGFAEVMMFALIAGGTSNNDLVAMIQPKEYFESRQKRLSIDSMIDVSITEPKDGKSQIMQLTALRYLTDESAAFKKAANYASNREAIEEIASGKRAQDKAGFAKEYAQRLLDKLDGKKPAPLQEIPTRAEGFSWFPAEATLLYAIDLRTANQLGAAEDALKEILKLMPKREKEQMYEVFEKIGNIRIERSVSAVVEGPGERNLKLYMRMTGKADHGAILDLIQAQERMQVKKIKDDKGTPISILTDPDGFAPTIMLIGNTDLVIVAHKSRDGKKDDVAQELLDVRAKKKPNAMTGKLKDRLAKIPDKSIALLVGDVPAEIKKELSREFPAIPDKISAHLLRTKQGLELQAEGGMANAEDAGKLVEKIASLRKDGIGFLKQAMQNPPPFDGPPIPFQSLIGLLESMQVENQADKVNARMTVPHGLIQQLPLMIMGSTTTKNVEKFKK